MTIKNSNKIGSDYVVEKQARSLLISCFVTATVVHSIFPNIKISILFEVQLNSNQIERIAHTN